MLKNYIKIAFKVLLRRKFFTFISLFAISFTLLVLMVATAFLDHVFGPMPPETRVDRTLGIFRARMSGPRSGRDGPPGYGFLDRYARGLPNVEKATFFTVPTTVSAFKSGERVRLFMKRTDGEFWDILQFNFLEGGPYSVADVNNAQFAAVINRSTSRKFFEGQPAVGKTIEADGQSFRVVGVVADVPIFRIVTFSDIWVPTTTAKSDAYKTELIGNHMGLLLARSAADFPLIKQELRSRVKRVELPDTRNYNHFQCDAETFFESFSRFLDNRAEDSSAGLLLGILIFLMILFLLLPTVNLININVSRILERTSEIGVRKAFGASSRTLVGQFLVENVFLVLLGGAIGFVLSLLVLQGITRSGLIPYAEFHLNYRIFLYGMLIALFFGLFSGVYPAWKMSRLHPVQALKGGLR